MAIPTAFPGGITTSPLNTALSQYGLPDPTTWHTFFDDFNKYTAGDWVVTTTEAGTGAASVVADDQEYGWLKITNDNADNDLVALQLVAETFQPVPGKKMLYKTRIKINETDQIDVKIGLYIRDTTPLAVNAGMYFSITDASANIDFSIIQGGTATTLSGIHTLTVDSEVVDLAFYYDGKSKIEVYVNNVLKGTITDLTNIPITDLAVSMFIQNGEADIGQMFVDYIFAATER